MDEFMEEAEDLDELVADFRDHLRASLLVTRSLDEAELTTVVGQHLGLLRVTADTLADYAMVLRRVPPSAQVIADSLDRMAQSLRLAIGLDDDEEEE